MKSGSQEEYKLHMVDAPNGKPREPVADEHGELSEPDDDHEERSYYYDDAHGYRDFDPDSDDDDLDD